MSMNATGEGKGDITLDSLFRALGHPTRRRTLRALRDQSAIEREELESVLARRSGRDAETVRTRLYHHHLPLLDEVDLIDWRRQESVVERGPNYEAVRVHVDAQQDRR